jgi:hypothetical protein
MVVHGYFHKYLNRPISGGILNHDRSYKNLIQFYHFAYGWFFHRTILPKGLVFRKKLTPFWRRSCVWL